MALMAAGLMAVLNHAKAYTAEPPTRTRRKSTTRKRQSENANKADIAAGMARMATGHRNERIIRPLTAMEAGIVNMRVEIAVWRSGIYG